MDFREATNALCEKVDHEAVSEALGVSLQTVRQARMDDGAAAKRTPPADWEKAIIRLAEDRVWHYRKLIGQLRKRD